MTDPDVRLRVTKVTSDIPDTFKFKVEDFDGDFGALSDVNCLYPMKDDSGVERIYLWSAGILILKVPINNPEESLYWVIPKTAESVDTDRGDWDITLANQFIITVCPSVDDSVRWIPFNPLADIGTVWTYPVSEEPEEEEEDTEEVDEYSDFIPVYLVAIKCSEEEESIAYTIHTATKNYDFLGQVCYTLGGRAFWEYVEILTSEEDNVECPCKYFRFKSVEGAYNYRAKFINRRTDTITTVRFYPQTCEVDTERAEKYGVKPETEEEEETELEEPDIGGFEYGFTSKIFFSTELNKLVLHIFFTPTEKGEYERLEITEVAFSYNDVLTTYPVKDCEFNIDTTDHKAIVFLTVTDLKRLPNHNENAYDYIARGILYPDAEETPEYHEECRLLGWLRPYETPVSVEYEEDLSYTFSPTDYEPNRDDRRAVRQAAAQYAQEHPEKTKKWYQKLMYIRRCRLRRDLRRLFIK